MSWVLVQKIKYTMSVYNLIDEKIDSYEYGYTIIDFDVLLEHI